MPKLLNKFKLVLFVLLPTIILTATLELSARLFFPTQSSILTLPLPEEYAGLLRMDPDLFWSLKPNLKTTYKNGDLTTNALGLRSKDIYKKEQNEYRILSLGESSTFGVGVDNQQTYSAILEHLLNQNPSKTKYSVINAGVSAYSSFQSLIYLKKRGLHLKPDMILLYHELNDYLPSSLRDSTHNELGVHKTDQQLFNSKTAGVNRFLMKHSSFIRLINYILARNQINHFNKQDIDNPLLKIGLPDIGLPSRLVKIENQNVVSAEINEKTLNQRVSEKERLDNLRAFYDISQRNNISLVIIHPSYASSQQHECLLTQFSQTHNIPMLEAYPILHPPGKKHTALYRDSWHPNALGHKKLATALYHFLKEKGQIF